MAEIAYTDEFEEWFENLDESDQDAVYKKVGLLEAQGTALGRPHTGSLDGTKHGCRELIVQSKGRPLRVFYNFNPDREGILFIGGDKTGNSRFYKEMIPQVDKIWEQYMDEWKASNPRKVP